MPDGRSLAERKCPTALATMAEEERRYDSLPPHLWRRPSTLADLERKIATVASHLGAIDAKIADGADLAYWRDCRARTEQQLAIYREAHSALMTDALARSTVRGSGGFRSSHDAPPSAGQAASMSCVAPDEAAQRRA